MNKPEIIPSLWHAEHLNEYDREDKREEVIDYHTANLIGSRYPTGTHAILLDLDCKHEYRPSSTPGHGHLVIYPKLGSVEWYQYRKLLELLTQLGVIEQGFYNLAVKREQAFLRTPHMRKGQEKALESLLELLKDTA